MMRNKIESLGQLVQMMHHELANIKDLAVGTMELIKKFPDYEKSLEELKDSIADSAGVASESEGANTGGKQKEVQPKNKAQE